MEKIMVKGLNGFKEWFRGYEDQFVIIGGTACDILMSEEGQDFRATKDIDMVLLVEALTADFGAKFWAYVEDGEYEHRKKSSAEPQFYRFSHPQKAGFPEMIELFSKRLDYISLPEDAVLTPLPLDDDLSSLSAILLDDEYYNLLLSGKTIIDGVSILNAEHLIPFKVKAWLDLTARKADGQAIDSKNIKKHKNDVFRLSQLLTPNSTLSASAAIKTDLENFFDAMKTESVDLKALGIRGTTEETVSKIMKVYL